jgi:hypothetical protein
VVQAVSEMCHQLQLQLVVWHVPLLVCVTRGGNLLPLSQGPSFILENIKFVVPSQFILFAVESIPYC